MNNTPQYNLLPIAKVINNRKWFILKTMLRAAVAGVLLYFIIPQKYEADTIFVLKNPLYADRNNIYNNETKFIDYFGNEDDIDRLIGMAGSDTVQNKIIRDMHLAMVYDYDTTNPKDVYKLRKRFNRNLKIIRNEQKNIVLSFADRDAKRAADIANMCVQLMENSLHGFYSNMRKNMYQSFMSKVQDEGVTINILTDSLAHLRDEYGIYDLISPMRYNIMSGAMKSNGHIGYAKGLEQIQNIESVKDELVADRARSMTLATQYSTATMVNEMPLIQVIKTAMPPVRYKNVTLMEAAVVSALLGFFFSILYVLMANYYSSQLKEN